LFGPTPKYFPFDIPMGLKAYFSENISQFFVIMYIPYLPELLFHINNLSIAMFFGLSILWIPSLLVLTWLIRQLFNKNPIFHGFRFYYAYIPILFTLFMPHTLVEIFSYDGSHLFSTLSEIFIMFISILSGMLYYLYGEKKFLAISAVSILLVNIQTFSMTFFLLSILFLFFSFLTINKGRALSRALLLVILAVLASFVYLYASNAMVSFPYYNLKTPSVLGPTDPNYRVFILSTLSSSRGLWNVLTMQNYVNDPYFPMYYPIYLYSATLFIITIISLFPFFYFSHKLRQVGMPIYLSLISFELMNSFANPFISLVFPQNIGIFYDLSYIFNNNTVFYYPLQILASLYFLIAILSLEDFFRFIKKHSVKLFTMEIRILNRKIREHWKPALAIIFAIVMLSPIISYDANLGSGNPVPYQDYEPFIAYFNSQKNASVYFDLSPENRLLSAIQSNSLPISNPQLTPDQMYPLSNAISLLNSVKEKLQPEYVDYILHLFGYNFFVTSNSTLSSELNHSNLFSMELNYSAIQVLKISKNVNQGKLVLLSSSASSLLKLVNDYRIFPTWIYSKYLLNIKNLENIFISDIPVYVPNYTTPQDLFPYVNGTNYLIPAQFTDNTYYSNRWKIGYLPQYAQETWTQNVPMLSNYSYQSELNVNYGNIFTSTSNTSLSVHYTLPKGNYAVLVNYLKSNIGGAFSVTLSGNNNYLNTENSSSFFVTSYVGKYTSGGGVNMIITNLRGFNTIAYLSFVPYSIYSKFLPIFSEYINSSSVNSIYSYLGVKHIYNLTISAPYTNRSMTYQQLFYLDLTLPGINSNLSNVLFTYTNGIPIYAFIQSISSNISKTAKIWLRMSGEFSRSLHLIVFSGNISFLGNYLGEAPSLSPVYGEFFNAPLVFGSIASSDAWDWVNSYQGWSSFNISATNVSDGVHVNSGFEGGICLPNINMTGKVFSIYGWTFNGTVIEANIYNGRNGFGYGFVGTSPYAIQKYPWWVKNIHVFGGKGDFYLFSIAAFKNGTMEASISNSTFSDSYYPVQYTGFQSDTLFVREVYNDPQYYEFAYLRSLPLDGVMPSAIVSMV
jgi:hypothetical protein